MAWKMSRRKRKEQKMQERREEQERLRQEILRHAETLAEEMNLRLLTEQKTDAEILFVESVTVAEICFPAEKKHRFAACFCLLSKLLFRIEKTLRNIIKK